MNKRPEIKKNNRKQPQTNPNETRVPTRPNHPRMPSMMSASNTALVRMKEHIDPCILSKYMEADRILQKRISDSEWLVVLDFGENQKTYEELERSMKAMEAKPIADETSPISPTTPASDLFMPLFDDGGMTNGKIMLQPSFSQEFIPDITWKAEPTALVHPPKDDATTMLIPSLRRLSNQLRVDFTSNVHGAEGKRRREPTRSIYEEAADSLRKKKQARAFKQTMKANKKSHKSDTGITKALRYDTSAEISEMEDEAYTPVGDDKHPARHEKNDSGTMETMMRAAASLAQLSTRAASAPSAHPATITEKMIETIAKAHNDTIAVKDEMIRSINATLVTKDELVRTQAMLIALMQQCAAARDASA